MAGVDASRMVAEDDAAEESEVGGGSAEVCDAGITGLRGQIYELLAGMKAFDGAKIVIGEEMKGGFMVVKDNDRPLCNGEVTKISKAVSRGGFQLEKVTVAGKGKDKVKAHVITPRENTSSIGAINGGRTIRRAGRKAARKERQAECRRTNPRLKPVK